MNPLAIFQPLWQWLRTVTGDAAYESYVHHAARIRPDAKPLSAREFYLDQLRRRYNSINRCC